MQPRISRTLSQQTQSQARVSLTRRNSYEHTLNDVIWKYVKKVHTELNSLSVENVYSQTKIVEVLQRFNFQCE